MDLRTHGFLTDGKQIVRTSSILQQWSRKSGITFGSVIDKYLLIAKEKRSSRISSLYAAIHIIPVHREEPEAETVGIQLRLDATETVSEEGYHLYRNKGLIIIASKGARGILYGSFACIRRLQFYLRCIILCNQTCRVSSNVHIVNYYCVNANWSRDETVREWWKDQMAKVFARIPNFGGFLVKADSEGREGPFTYILFLTVCLKCQNFFEHWYQIADMPLLSCVLLRNLHLKHLVSLWTKRGRIWVWPMGYLSQGRLPRNWRGQKQCRHWICNAVQGAKCFDIQWLGPLPRCTKTIFPSCALHIPVTLLTITPSFI